MFNLLPDNLKKEVKSNYRLRFWVVAVGMILCVEAAFFILLLPSWFDSLYKEKAAVLQTERLDQSLKTNDTQSITTMIASINATLTVVNTSLEYPKILPIVNVIISKKTNNISISQFTYVGASATSATVTLSGVSRDRESLVSFVKSLQDSGAFKNVDLPISNFTKDTNIKFSLSMSVEQ